MVYLNCRTKGILRRQVIKQRRDTLYKMLFKKHDGHVHCFVCGKHVKEKSATVEHVLPLSKGGTDDMDNLSISHNFCNMKRGNDE